MMLRRWSVVLALAAAAAPASALAAIPSPVLSAEPHFTQGSQNVIRWNRIAFPAGSIGRGYLLRVRDVTTGSATSLPLADEAAAAVAVPNLVDAHAYRYTVQAFAQECTTASCTAFTSRTFGAASPPQTSVQDARPPVGTLAIDGGASFVNGLDVTMNIAASDPQPGAGVTTVFTWGNATNVICPPPLTISEVDLKSGTVTTTPAAPNTSAFCPLPFTDAVPYSLTPGPDGPRTVRIALGDGAASNGIIDIPDSLATGNRSAEIATTVTLDTFAPAVTLVVGAQPAVAGQPVAFDVSASKDTGGLNADSGVDGPGARWTFGDGTSATGATLQHTYAQAGTFSGEVQVPDRAGNVTTASFSLVVNAGGAPGAPATFGVAGGLAGGDRVAPRLSRVRVLGRTARIRATRLSLRSTEAGRLTADIFRVSSGRLKRVAKRSIVLRRGAQTLNLGRLSAGAYQALVVATDGAGNRSVPRLVAFSVRAGRR